MPSELAAALLKVQQKLKPIKRTATGQRGRYPSLPTVHKAILPLLAEQDLVFIGKPTQHGDGRFVLAYSLIHIPSGEREDGEYPMHVGPAQQQGSEVTYARRYALMAITNAVAEGEDDDGAAASQRRGPERYTGWDRPHDDTPSPGPRPGPEHERLRNEPPSDGGAWDGDDHWKDQPPGQLNGAPKPASPAQIGAVWTVLSKVFKFSREEHDAARAVCAHILRHPLASSKEMTKAEAKKVLDDLSEWQELAQASGMTPREFLTQEMVGAASAAGQDAVEGAQEPVDAP